jgi:cell division septum initiation protein DivIVA
MDEQMANGNPQLQGVHVLIAAQRQADQVIADARALAAQVAGDAEVHRDKILAEAEDDASLIRVHASQDASRMLVETRAKAPLEAQARYAYYRALGDALSAQLAAVLMSLQAAVTAYEAQGEPEQSEFVFDDGASVRVSRHGHP